MEIIIIILVAYIVLGQIALLVVGEYVKESTPLFMLLMFLLYPIGTLLGLIIAWHRANVEKRLEKKGSEMI